MILCLRKTLFSCVLSLSTSTLFNLSLVDTTGYFSACSILDAIDLR